MRRIHFLFMILFLVACQKSGQTTKEIEMYNTVGDMVGTATFSEQENGVKIKVNVTGLAPGFHGIHVHEHPKCEGPQFTSAGNHLNPEGNQHGLMHPDGAHLGDLPNIEADQSGDVDTELMLNGATLLEGKNSLFAKEGVSLIIDAGQDDGVSQPSGDAGEREFCGVLKKNEEKSNEDSPSDPTEDREEDNKET